MSYGVALRNGVPFTLGTIAALCVNATTQWNPLALWPDGIATPGMWISPRDLTSQWQDYLGTTPVSTPGTVADSSNPVGLALDIRAGATVLTDPGNHMLQSTSAARPLASARVNLLTYTDDLAATYPLDATIESTSVTPPNGIVAAKKLVGTATASSHRMVFSPVPAGKPLKTFTIYAKSEEIRRFYVFTGADYATSWFDTTSEECGVMPEYNTSLSRSITNVGGGWCRCEMVSNVTALANLQIGLLPDGATSINQANTPLDGLGMYFCGAQLEYGTQATDYQSVPGDGSTYTTTGFPIAKLYDGVDDGMATAAFAAGTLINGMDCLIVVRRDGNSQQALGGLYQLDQTKYFGVIGTDSGSAAGTHNGCGTPTIFVDGVEVANTRGALYDAIGLGEFHILEYRGLDLSAWVDAGFGYYASGYQLIGARGDIMLFPSTASTTDKDAARQWLADYYGVTLP